MEWKEHMIETTNGYLGELRGRFDNLLKHLLLTSGAVQTFTVGAFLNADGIQLQGLEKLLMGTSWMAFAICSALCIIVMIIQVKAMTNKARDLQTKAEAARNDKTRVEPELPEVHTVSESSRKWIWAFTSVAFMACVAGFLLLAGAAITIFG